VTHHNHNQEITMRNTTALVFALLFISTVTTGCFVSRKETVREVPSASTTRTEHTSTVETAPQSEVRSSTTVQKY
jgi:hypothetical protein